MEYKVQIDDNSYVVEIEEMTACNATLDRADFKKKSIYSAPVKQKENTILAIECLNRENLCITI